MVKWLLDCICRDTCHVYIVGSVHDHVVVFRNLCYLVLPWLQELYWQGEAVGCPQQEECSPVPEAFSSPRRHQTVWDTGKNERHLRAIF